MINKFKWWTTRTFLALFSIANETQFTILQLEQVAIPILWLTTEEQIPATNIKALPN